MMQNDLNDQISARLHGAHSILVVSHIRPDGDAVGSVLGLGLALEAAGKSVQMVLADGVPESLRFIPESDRIKCRSESTTDLVIVVDSAELQRVGEALLSNAPPDINIDHHISNTNYGKINFVLSDAAATAEILAGHLPLWGFEIPPASAQALLTGMLTDTIGFRIPSVSPNTLRLAAGLMEGGANLSSLYSQALMQRTAAAARYWGAGLSSLQLEGSLLWATLRLADRQQAGYPGKDDADLVNILSGVREAEIAVIFVEQPDERVKISWRARAGFDVAQLAALFGGGGHKAAAGADVQGNLPDVQRAVLAATRKLLQPNIHSGEMDNHV